VTGLLGALGWVGYQQLPAAAPKGESTKTDEQFVLEGDTASPPEAEFEFARTKTVEPAEVPPLESSPFDTPHAFQPTPAAVTAAEQSAAGPADNPFAAFTPKQTAMAAEETAFAQPPRIHPTPRRRDLAVTPAANEAPAVSAVELFEIAGQSEPAPPPNTTPDQSAPTPDAAADPFAAFATQPVPSTGPASTVPAPLGGQNQAASITADAEWAAQPAVTPVQFAPNPAFAAAPPQFQPEAKPIEAANRFAPEPVPALDRAPTAEWPPFDQHPATIEPRVSPRRMAQQPIDSPSNEPAQTTSFNVPQPTAPANDPRDEELHVVQQGETYWSIARQHYGAGRYFQALAEYNKPRISDQASLKPGMKVLVPSAVTLDTRYGKAMQVSGLAKPPAKPHAGLRIDPQGRPLYVVGEGDTLGEISRRYLGKTSRSEEISRLNQEQLPNPNKLKAGMILVMPDDAAEVQSASSIPGRR
jgi:nucleoid-associated protein YgaU